MKSLILTLDYELYGNGSGDIYTHIIEPTERILALAEQYKAKITFFVEVVEFWRIENEWLKGNTMGYSNNPIDDIRKQLQEARMQGHDIQLHIHPQWVDAEYRNGAWSVNLADWRLGGYDKQGEYSLENLLVKGKATLEEWIKPVDAGYECIALRAGGYNIQPSGELVKAMQTAGLKIDSSIYPGGKETGTLSNYDYSSIAADKELWQTGNELEKEGASGIYELPIVAFPIKRWKKFASIERIKSLFRNTKSTKETFKAKTSTKDGKKSSKLDKIKYFFQDEWQTWDYCLFSVSLHNHFLKEINKQKSRQIITLVGHPKSFSSKKGFIHLLEQTKKEYRYTGISSAILFINKSAGQCISDK